MKKTPISTIVAMLVIMLFTPSFAFADNASKKSNETKKAEKTKKPVSTATKLAIANAKLEGEKLKTAQAKKDLASAKAELKKLRAELKKLNASNKTLNTQLENLKTENGNLKKANGRMKKFLKARKKPEPKKPSVELVVNKAEGGVLKATVKLARADKVKCWYTAASKSKILKLKKQKDGSWVVEAKDLPMSYSLFVKATGSSGKTHKVGKKISSKK